MSPRSTAPHCHTRRQPAAGRLLTQQQAASLAGCSRDTIVRARRAGRFPHARLLDGRWSIPAADLDDAGFLATPGTESVEAGAPGDGGAEEPVDLVLARAEARIAALEDLVARQDAELAFLRQLAVETVSKKAS
jgi:excisionase family DNA binding protein